MVRLLLPLVAAAILVACAGDRDQPGAAYSGGESFATFCASCHGMDARGRGPVAEFLSAPVPDLTLIAARRGGEFPVDEVFRIVDGQADMAAHGTRHMPVWGYEFFSATGDDEQAHGEVIHRIDALVEYLRSIQRAQ